jgi:hypothetical protein
MKEGGWMEHARDQNDVADRYPYPLTDASDGFWRVSNKSMKQKQVAGSTKYLIEQLFNQFRSA